jgi:hypothetical protein
MISNSNFFPFNALSFFKKNNLNGHFSYQEQVIFILKTRHKKIIYKLE